MSGLLRPNQPSKSAPSFEAEADALVDRLGVLPSIDIVVPRTRTRARMRLLSRGELHHAKAQARRALQDSGFPTDGTAVTSLGAWDEWQYELAVQMFAVAVREPDPTVDRALCSIDEWREECDDDQIAALNRQYQDLAARHDPLGEGAAALTSELEIALLAAAKKKDADLLMSYGSRALATFIITSVDQPASSPTPTS
ncbi:MAG: hypothetical protein ACTHU0_01390 [Kofleriaceae bacterium]